MSDDILGMGVNSTALSSVARETLAGGDSTVEHNDYRSVFEAAPQSMWIYDVETRRVIAGNGAARRRYRYNSAQFLALVVADLVVADQEPPTPEGKAWSMRVEGVEAHRAGDGTIFEVSVASSAVSFAGRLASLVVVSDIPGSVTPAIEDPRLNEQLRLVLESSGEGIYSIDKRGVCLFANAAVSRMTGYDLSHLVGHNLHDLLHHSHPDGGAYQVEDCQIYQVLQTGRPSRVDDEVLWRADATPLAVVYSSYPILVDGVVTGAVVTFSDMTERRAVERQLADANDELRRWTVDLERRNRAVSLVNAMGDVMQTAVTPEEAYEIVARFGEQLFPDTVGTVGVLDSSHHLIEVAGNWGSRPSGARTFEAAECWALRQGSAYSSAADKFPCPHLQCGRDNRSLCIPMLAHGEEIGVLSIVAPAAPAESEPATLENELTTAIGAHIGLALANFSLRAAVREQTIRDPLTNLFNRRYMEESLEREVARAGRSGEAIAILQVDIDHFKAFNDTYGHGGGDTVLTAVARLFSSTFRGHDIACRSGGEEFTVILPGASSDTARQRADQLRQHVAELDIVWQNNSIASPTISVGVAVKGGVNASGRDILQAADAALYEAKNAGRDRVVVATQARPHR